MNGVGRDQYLLDNIGLIHKVASRAQARIVAIGGSMEFEDVAQELSLVFLRAYDGFDPSRGTAFSTYFTSAAWNQVNRIIKGMELERIELKLRSVEEIDSYGDDDSMSILEAVASDAMTPEEILSRNQVLESVVRELLPEARLMIEWLHSSPDWLHREMTAHAAHCEYARKMGIEKRHRPGVSLNLIAATLKMLGADVARIDKAKKSLSNLLRS